MTPCISDSIYYIKFSGVYLRMPLKQRNIASTGTPQSFPIEATAPVEEPNADLVNVVGGDATSKTQDSPNVFAILHHQTHVLHICVFNCLLWFSFIWLRAVWLSYDSEECPLI